MNHSYVDVHNQSSLIFIAVYYFVVQYLQFIQSSVTNIWVVQEVLLL